MTCTRRLEFDAAHRVLRHESKCRHVHGHRYCVEVTCSGALDSVGRVIDFGVVKSIFGEWLDATMDHAYLASPLDEFGILLREQGQKVFTMPSPVNPTAERLVEVLAAKAQELLGPKGVQVTAVRLYETPNCWADWSAE